MDEFLSLVEEIRKSEPRLLRRLKFPEGLDEDFQALLPRVDQELERHRSYSPDKDGYDSEADASFGLAASLKRLEKAAAGIEEAAKRRISNLTLNANRCREKYQQLELDEQGDYSAEREEHRLRSSPPSILISPFLSIIPT